MSVGRISDNRPQRKCGIRQPLSSRLASRKARTRVQPQDRSIDNGRRDVDGKRGFILPGDATRESRVVMPIIGTRRHNTPRRIEGAAGPEAPWRRGSINCVDRNSWYVVAWQRIWPGQKVDAARETRSYSTGTAEARSNGVRVYWDTLQVRHIDIEYL